eukprot:3938376-Rhodomonas_salina.1
MESVELDFLRGWMELRESSVGERDLDLAEHGFAVKRYITGPARVYDGKVYSGMKELGALLNCSGRTGCAYSNPCKKMLRMLSKRYEQLSADTVENLIKERGWFVGGREKYDECYGLLSSAYSKKEKSLAR